MNAILARHISSNAVSPRGHVDWLVVCRLQRHRQLACRYRAPAMVSAPRVTNTVASVSPLFETATAKWKPL